MEYEQTTHSLAFFDKVEGAMAKNAASKDKIIFAQRLHEIDLERKHEREIAQLKEEYYEKLLRAILSGS